jgi:hypothetical protein
MRNTNFAVTFPVTIEAIGHVWNLTCTASHRFDDPPALLWCENNGPTGFPPWVPGDVWDAVEDELTIGGPARDAYEAAMNKADVPFMAEAAE